MNSINYPSIARDHARNVTNMVRSREEPNRIASSPNLDIMFSSDASFENSRQLTIMKPYLLNGTFSDYPLGIDCEDAIKISGKKFVICTGAGPIIPKHFKKSATDIQLPLLTYRSIFRFDREGSDS